MDGEIVMLSSDSDEDLRVVDHSPSKALQRIPTTSCSDDDLLNLDLDSPVRQQHADDDVLEIETQNENLDIVPESNYCNLDLNPSRHAIIQGPTFSYASLVSKAVETVPKSKKLVSKTKQDKLLEKAVKAAETANKRFNKATECLKNLTTLLDSRLLDAIPSSGSILTQLQESEIKHSIVVSTVANSVCWTRDQVNHYVNDKAEVCSKTTTVGEEDGVVVLLPQEFILISRHSICDHINQLKKTLQKTKLTIIVYGILAYFKEQSKKDKKRFRDRVSASGETSNKTNRKEPINDAVTFSVADMEALKVKLVLETECSLWPVETSEELGKILARLSKAIAERPYKEERLEQTFDFYAGDVSGNIKVNKDGHGLERLWQQQLMQFPLVALETSQAIASRYQSPQALIKAYEQCDNETEASLLLQDIPIRRHAGPLSTSRKVGPELSKRIHRFLMSKDGFALL